MMFKFLKVVGASILLASSPYASSAFIDNDSFTTDTVAGLDWLDWSLTTSMTRVDDFNLYSGDGYRVAGATEINAMLERFFDVTLDTGTFIAIRAPNDFQAMESFFDMFGMTYNNNRSYVTLEGDDGGQYGVRNKRDRNAVYIYSSYIQPRQTITGSGVPLVRVAKVPEPGTLAIFALGIMAMISRRFKKQALSCLTMKINYRRWTF